MRDTMTSTATTFDVPVLPDRNVRYESLAPAGRPHAAYLVEAAEPTPRDSDQHDGR
jgi:hypothetical protein